MKKLIDRLLSHPLLWIVYLVMVVLFLSGCGRYALQDDIDKLTENQSRLNHNQKQIIKLLEHEGILTSSDADNN